MEQKKNRKKKWNRIEVMQRPSLSRLSASRTQSHRILKEKKNDKKYKSEYK